MLLGFLLAELRMEQILNSFGDIVMNACDSLRLHEECDLLSLRIDKVRSYIGVTGLHQLHSIAISRIRAGLFLTCTNMHPACCLESRVVAKQVLWDFFHSNVVRSRRVQ